MEVHLYSPNHSCTTVTNNIMLYIISFLEINHIQQSNSPPIVIYCTWQIIREENFCGWMQNALFTGKHLWYSRILLMLINFILRHMAPCCVNAALFHLQFLLSVLHSMEDSCTFGGFIIDNMVWGHHVYQEVWTPVIVEYLDCAREEENPQGRFAVAVLKRDTIVGRWQYKV